MYAETFSNLIEELKKMPGIGPKSAQRLAFYILQSSSKDVAGLVFALQEAKERLKYCSVCFNITDIDPKMEFYIAAVMDQIVKWLREGKTTEMMGQDGHRYDAVEFGKGFIVLKSVKHLHPVAVLDTKSEDKVYLTFLDEINDDERQFGFQMAELSQSITNGLKEFLSINLRGQNIDYEKYRSYFTPFNHVLMPKIDFEGDININWIVNMKTVDLWYISDAKMKAKLKLNHIGARAQSAVFMMMTRSVPPPPKILKFESIVRVYNTRLLSDISSRLVQHKKFRD